MGLGDREFGETVNTGETGETGETWRLGKLWRQGRLVRPGRLGSPERPERLERPKRPKWPERPKRPERWGERGDQRGFRDREPTKYQQIFPLFSMKFKVSCIFFNFFTFIFFL